MGIFQRIFLNCARIMEFLSAFSKTCSDIGFGPLQGGGRTLIRLKKQTAPVPLSLSSTAESLGEPNDSDDLEKL